MRISPSAHTSNRRPIITFQTTDAVSGIDHYELKIISLDPPRARASSGQSSGESGTSFFIESASPYAEELDIGRYDVVVRAYDRAGNFAQTQTRLAIVIPLFEIIRDRGVEFFGVFEISWPYVGLGALLVFAFLLVAARALWQWHRRVEHELEAGALAHPQVREKLEELTKKQNEYSNTGKTLLVWGLIVAAGLLFGVPLVSAETHQGVAIAPPVVTLFPNSLSNDEILYIGGRAGAPGGEVIVNLQRVETGSTISQTVATDETGAWFYSFPEFLTSGTYRAWTQFKVGEERSLPSPQMGLTVAPAAIQIGAYRLSYQNLYALLFIAFMVLSLALIAFIVYHARHLKIKKGRLLKEIREAEESVRRGFSLLRRDIEEELKVVRKAKLNKALSVEETMREEKLMKDLESVSSYIGREIWDIEEAEKGV